MKKDNEEIVIESYGYSKAQLTLKRNIFIPANIILSSAPLERHYIEKHYELIIGIGNNHYATLTISESALRAVNSLEPDVSIY